MFFLSGSDLKFKLSSATKNIFQIHGFPLPTYTVGFTECQSLPICLHGSRLIQISVYIAFVSYTSTWHRFICKHGSSFLFVYSTWLLSLICPYLAPVLIICLHGSRLLSCLHAWLLSLLSLFMTPGYNLSA